MRIVLPVAVMGPMMPYFGKPELWERGARAYMGHRANTRRYSGGRETLGCGAVPGYNRGMREGNFTRLTLILLSFVLLTPGLSGFALAGDEATGTVLLPCPAGSPGAVSCNPSKKEIKEA